MMVTTSNRFTACSIGPTPTITRPNVDEDIRERLQLLTHWKVVVLDWTTGVARPAP